MMCNYTAARYNINNSMMCNYTAARYNINNSMMCNYTAARHSINNSMCNFTAARYNINSSMMGNYTAVTQGTCINNSMEWDIATFPTVRFRDALNSKVCAPGVLLSSDRRCTTVPLSSFIPIPSIVLTFSGDPSSAAHQNKRD